MVKKQQSIDEFFEENKRKTFVNDLIEQGKVKYIGKMTGVGGIGHNIHLYNCLLCQQPSSTLSQNSIYEHYERCHKK